MIPDLSPSIIIIITLPSSSKKVKNQLDGTSHKVYSTYAYIEQLKYIQGDTSSPKAKKECLIPIEKHQFPETTKISLVLFYFQIFDPSPIKIKYQPLWPLPEFVWKEPQIPNQIIKKSMMLLTCLPPSFFLPFPYHHHTSPHLAKFTVASTLFISLLFLSSQSGHPAVIWHVLTRHWPSPCIIPPSCGHSVRIKALHSAYI